ncbi:hypothetical protein MFUM_1020044 [Methylacidiphilum fumariolicum SolV]|uniref:Uncharacterized protein n=2 Tax=Candidatus Methylacidiphilum fumarolicum TaxID=591154 RepID=I0JVQ1_METFB|nr:conserved protein of unknown function [Candidatus Methylacidiphilum fumarolicum]CCG91320.1 hypothetical protein MFUM_1020044 [Methylacidiphilum fumariolicum SolV]
MLTVAQSAGGGHSLGVLPVSSDKSIKEGTADALLTVLENARILLVC